MEGVQGAGQVFGALAEELGLSYEEYSSQALRSERIYEPGGEFQSLLNRKPALLVLPTSVCVREEFVRFLGGRSAAIATISTGTDHVDLGLLQSHNIPFIHAPGANAQSVGQYVLAAISFCCAEQDLLSGRLKVGIVGYGRTGKAVGRYLKKLAIPYVFYDPFVEDDGHGTSLQEALRSDILTFHLPLTTGGKHPTSRMVNNDLVSKIAPSSLVINTSRGGIFSEEAYARVCENRTTVMDVFPVEPPAFSHLEPATYVTPHVAGYNYEARVGGVCMVADQLARLSGSSWRSELPEPAGYDHYVIDFLPSESRRLKSDPTSFSKRRNGYPYRGDFLAVLRNRDQFQLSPFQERLLVAAREIFQERKEGVSADRES